MPISEECLVEYTTQGGRVFHVPEKDCAYKDLIERGKVLVEKQLNDIEDIMFKPKDDQWGEAYVIVTIPKEARGPQGWHAVDDLKLQKKVMKIVRQRSDDWIRENGGDEEE